MTREELEREAGIHRRMNERLVAALREIDAMRTKPIDNFAAAYAEVCEIARRALELRA